MSEFIQRVTGTMNEKYLDILSCGESIAVIAIVYFVPDSLFKMILLVLLALILLPININFFYQVHQNSEDNVKYQFMAIAFFIFITVYASFIKYL